MTSRAADRLRVWDSLHGDMAAPTHELVHSHDFARYLTPFKAVWDPKDERECTVICGRYISEDFAGVKLHPVDVLSTYRWGCQF